MKTSEALAFLENNQPLPPDTRLTQQEINIYDQVRRFFLENYDVRCIQLFLGSFGDGSGFGVYQLVEDVLLQFPPQEVIHYLKLKLNSEHRGVRYWCAQIASSFPDPILVPALSILLKDIDADIRIMAAVALGTIGGKSVVEVLQKALPTEHDEDAREAIEESLRDLS